MELSYQAPIMADNEPAATTDALDHEACTFWEQLMAEVSNTYLDFFYYKLRFIRTNFYLLYSLHPTLFSDFLQISPMLGSRSDLVFH